MLNIKYSFTVTAHHWQLNMVNSINKYINKYIDNIESIDKTHKQLELQEQEYMNANKLRRLKTWWWGVIELIDMTEHLYERQDVS